MNAYYRTSHQFLLFILLCLDDASWVVILVVENFCKIFVFYSSSSSSLSSSSLFPMSYVLCPMSYVLLSCVSLSWENKILRFSPSPPLFFMYPRDRCFHWRLYLQFYPLICVKSIYIEIYIVTAHNHHHLAKSITVLAGRNGQGEFGSGSGVGDCLKRHHPSLADNKSSFPRQQQHHQSSSSSSASTAIIAILLLLLLLQSSFTAATTFIPLRIHTLTARSTTLIFTA